MFTFTPRTIPSKIFVVGCGGTGSRLVPLLTQFMASITKGRSPRGWVDNPEIFLFDFDEVEDKNLARQNFIAADVGKNKAAVLAQRYGRAYNMNLVAVPERFHSSFTFGSLSSVRDSLSVFSNSMVIMCVDSAQARRDILIAIDRHMSDRMMPNSVFVIDAGNEDNFGQVTFFNMCRYIHSARVLAGLKQKIPAMSPITGTVPHIPIDLKHYSQLEDLPGQGSCADLDQTLAINAIMAAEIMGIVQNYYYVKPFTYNTVSTSLDGARSVTMNTAQELLRRGLDSSELKDTYNTLPLSSINLDGNDGVYLTDQINGWIEESKIELEKLMPKVEASELSEAAVEVEGEASAPKKPRKTRRPTPPVSVEQVEQVELMGPVAPAEPVEDRIEFSNL